jgi:hypothetical protein
MKHTTRGLLDNTLVSRLYFWKLMDWIRFQLLNNKHVLFDKLNFHWMCVCEGGGG